MLSLLSPSPLAVALCGLLPGCTGSPDEQQPPAASVTWHQDIALIVIQRCSGCHEEGGIGPFPLETYEQAKSFAPAMLMAIESGSMPPFLAQDTSECTPPL